METLGARIKRIRGNTTQRQFAEILGVPQTTLANYESNKSELNFRMIGIFVSKFKVRTDWLIFGKGPMYLDDVSSLSKSTSEPAAQAVCKHCAELEEELRSERAERRELATENRQLWRENGDLRERVARLEAKIDGRAETPVEASLFDARPPIPSSSQATPPADKTI